MIEDFDISDYRLFNPLFYYLLNYYSDGKVRNIILYGGSSSGKSYSVAQSIIVQTFYDGENTIIFRKVGASISKTIYEDFKVAARQLGVFHTLRFKESLKQILFPNGAKIDFQGLDDPEKIKGISNYKRVVLEEWSEYDEEDDKQIRKRLRGKEGQQRIMMFNPISEKHWIKTSVFDREEWHDLPMRFTFQGKEFKGPYVRVKSHRMNSPKQIFNPRTKDWEEHAPDTVAIQTTYLNNFWVVGSPCGTFGYYDRQCIADFEKDRINDPDYYNIYALGEWGVLRTGSEFFGSFNRGQHTGPVTYDPNLPIHISVDNNYLPYITTTLWQIDTTEGICLRQIGEVLAGPPDNDVRSAARLTAKKIAELHSSERENCDRRVIMHGDASTRAANTIDPEKRSFHDLYIDTLSNEGIEVEDKVGYTNPSVAMTGQFINAILEGVVPDVTLLIGQECIGSIDDYLSVQKDANGGMLKIREKNHTTGQSYEKNGHCSDTLRYIVHDVANDVYTIFSNKRKRNIYAKDGRINYYYSRKRYNYTEEMVYCIPDLDYQYAYIHAKRIGERWHVVDCRLNSWLEELHDGEIESDLIASKSPTVTMECTKEYYPLVRSLRQKMPEVRVMHLQSGIPERIKATADFVKTNILFDAENPDPGYARFVNSLLDYRQGDRDNLCASAVLSGFAKRVAKSHFEENSL